ncbi:hypothetical protein AAFP35_21700 [Gordonia sp. CPCC 206044]|uniref:hypothetical protein n=1 Tax=Gordonia sp. CPCC 206044 TaxID=3140793 RepID=UPI003AF37FAE
MTEQDKNTDEAAESREPDNNSADNNSADNTDNTEGTDPAREARKPQTKSARTSAARRARQTTSGTADGAAQESAGADDEPAAGTSRGREISLTFTTGGLAKVLAAVLAIAVVVGVVVLGWGYYDQRARLAAFDDSKAASQEFSIKLVSTMNTDNVGSMKELLGPLSTGEFRKHLEQEQSDGQKAVKELDVKATPTVKSVSVENFDSETAKTSVLMEVTGTSTLAPKGGKELMLIWLNLRNVDGKWLVEKLDGAQAGIGEPQGQQGQQNQSAPAPAPAPAG